MIEIGVAMYILFAAIEQVEGWKGPGTFGTYGEVGPYQITAGYWKDANVSGSLDRCDHKEYSQEVMLAYWRRYCPEALRDRDYKTLAAVHHFGPKGRTAKTYPDDYVERVMNIINERKESKR